MMYQEPRSMSRNLACHFAGQAQHDDHIMSKMEKFNYLYKPLESRDQSSLLDIVAEA